MEQTMQLNQEGFASAATMSYAEQVQKSRILSSSDIILGDREAFLTLSSAFEDATMEGEYGEKRTISPTVVGATQTRHYLVMRFEDGSKCRFKLVVKNFSERNTEAVAKKHMQTLLNELGLSHAVWWFEADSSQLNYIRSTAGIKNVFSRVKQQLDYFYGIHLPD